MFVLILDSLLFSDIPKLCSSLKEVFRERQRDTISSQFNFKHFVLRMQVKVRVFILCLNILWTFVQIYRVKALSCQTLGTKIHK
jgi:hypothetical protein